MNDVITLFTNGIISYLLVASVVATALTVLAWLIIKLPKIKTPVYCYMIWLSTLIIIITLPVIWLYGPKMSIKILPTHNRSVETITLPQALITPIPQVVQNIPTKKTHSLLQIFINPN